MKMLGANIQAEEASAFGYADAIVETKKAVYVFEFKFNRSAKAAIRQIRERGYAAAYKADKRPVTLVGINFSAKKRNIDIPPTGENNNEPLKLLKPLKPLKPPARRCTGAVRADGRVRDGRHRAGGGGAGIVRQGVRRQGERQGRLCADLEGHRHEGLRVLRMVRRFDARLVSVQLEVHRGGFGQDVHREIRGGEGRRVRHLGQEAVRLRARHRRDARGQRLLRRDAARGGYGAFRDGGQGERTAERRQGRDRNRPEEERLRRVHGRADEGGRLLRHVRGEERQRLRAGAHAEVDGRRGGRWRLR